MPMATGPLELPVQIKKKANGTASIKRDRAALNGPVNEPKAASHRSQYSLVLGLSSLNGTFEKKSLVLPFYPDVMRLGRQTSSKTLPAPDNGFFDSRVLSRAHAEIWADYETAKVWIKDSKSSNGTFVNGLRLGDEKSESEPQELNKNDVVELGIDIANDEGTSFIHRKISAKVDRISYLSLQAKTPTTHQQTLVQQPNQMINGLVSGLKNKQNGMRSSRAAIDGLDVALFGDMDASLEDISLSHARSSMTGRYMNSGVASSATLELIVKKLVGEIHAAKVESAKIQSVQKLLTEINTNQQESRLLAEKLPSLTEFKKHVSKLTAQLDAARAEIREKDQHIAELERALAHSMEHEIMPPNNPEYQVPNRTISPPIMPPFNEPSVDQDPPHIIEKSQTPVPKSPRQVKPAKTPDVEKLQAVLAELEETKCELSLFKHRAFAAEELAVKHGKTIGELMAASSINSAAAAAPHTGITVTMASALGVVVVGVSFMAMLNSFSREPFKNV